MQTKIVLLLAALCACCSLGLAVKQSETVLLDVPSTKLKDPAAEVTINAVAPSDGNTKVEPTTDVPSTPDVTHPAPVTNPAPVTTKAPVTTTPATTNSTAPPTTTSTPAPITTSTAAPAPAPKPTPAPGPVPQPEQGSWVYKDANTTCIMIQFAAQLNVTYTKANSSGLAYVILNVPANASVVSGNCEGDDQLITLSWPVENSNITNTMTLNYHKNVSTNSYGLKSLDFALSPDVFVNSTSNTVLELTHGCEWQTPLATSYRCAAPSRMNMTSMGAAVGALTLSHLQEEAFRPSTAGKDFSAARECGGADLPDAVPIAVGCALGGLVVVVLVAYLVGRRTSAARGYLSM